MPEYPERFFISTPVLTSEKRKCRGEELLPIYVDDEGQRVMWSGAFPLPSLESRVFITRNGIGWAIVKGYFVSAGYLGVMTLPIDPPVWLCNQWIGEQNNGSSPEWAKQGIGCEYGSELALVAPQMASLLHNVALTLLYCLETFEATCQCGTCDPCTKGREDIKASISTLEMLATAIKRTGA